MTSGNLFFFVGACALFAQTVLLREAVAVFQGSESLLALGLAAWLAGTAFGALRPRVMPFERRLLLAAVAGPAAVLILRLFKGMLPPGATPGAAAMVVPMLLLAGPSWLWGSLYAAAAKDFPSPVRLYGWETAGALAGGVLSVGVFAAGCPALPVLCGLSAVATLAARKKAASLGLALFTLLSIPLNAALRQWEMRGGELVSFAETPYGHAARTRWGNENVFYENGRIVARSPDPALEEETAHLPLLLHPRPETVLGIGPGAILAGPEMLRHGLRRLDLVHAEGRTVRFLGSSAAVEDPRRWIRRHPGAYDVIVCSLPAGDGGGSNRFFTREFFLEARRALRPGGVLAFFFPAAENRLTGTEAVRFKGTLAAVSDAFPNVEVFPGERALVAASDRTMAVDAPALAARFLARGIKARTLGPEDFARRFDPERREAFRRRLDALPQPRANSDLIPRGIFQAQVAGVERDFSLGGALSLCFLVSLGIWAARRVRRVSGRGNGLLIVVGFGALAYETALLFLYQAASGALYGELGVLFALFMAGMALGCRVAVGPPVVWAAAWAVLAAGSAPAAPLLARAEHPLVFFGALLAAAGLLTGGVFASAARRNPERAGALYGADSLGAALGAAVAGTVALPWIGIPASFWGIAALTAAGCAASRKIS